MVKELNVTNPAFAALYRKDIIRELLPYGGLNTRELLAKDDNELKEILLWLKCGDIQDRRFEDENENNETEVVEEFREPTYNQQFFYNMFFYDNTHSLAYDELYRVFGDNRDWNVRHFHATLCANFDLTFVGMTGGFPEDL